MARSSTTRIMRRIAPTHAESKILDALGAAEQYGQAVRAYFAALANLPVPPGVNEAAVRAFHLEIRAFEADHLALDEQLAEAVRRFAAKGAS